MSNINPLTGNESPRKYYASPYLDEVTSLKEAIQHSAADGGEVDLDTEHPLTIQEVVPEDLTETQKQYLDDGSPEEEWPTTSTVTEEEE